MSTRTPWGDAIIAWISSVPVVVKDHDSTSVSECCLYPEAKLICFLSSHVLELDSYNAARTIGIKWFVTGDVLGCLKNRDEVETNPAMDYVAKRMHQFSLLGCTLLGWRSGNVAVAKA